MATGKGLWDEPCRLRIELLFVEVDELHAGLGGRRTDEVFFGNEAELAQDLAEGPACRRPLAQSGFHLLARDLPGTHEHLGKIRRRRLRGVRGRLARPRYRPRNR